MKLLTDERPWGRFRQFTENEETTVKTIFIKKGESLSLQYHNHRSEFWCILSGTPDVTIGDTVTHAKAGDEFEVSVKTNHRIGAVNDDVEFLEISSGNFDENDIVRLEDNYGRS